MHDTANQNTAISGETRELLATVRDVLRPDYEEEDYQFIRDRAVQVHIALDFLLKTEGADMPTATAIITRASL